TASSGHAGSLVVPVGDTAVTMTVPVPRRVPMAAEKPIRILIADDQHLVRQGFRAMFDRVPLVEVVAEASTLKGTIDQYARHRPDVLIMDLRFLDGCGVDAIRAIREQFLLARIVVLTTYDGDEDIYRSLQA